MSQPAIRVDGLGKRYKLGLTHAGSIRELVNGTARRLTGRRPHSATGDPALDPARVDDEGHFWALKDVSFEVQPGEVVGIIGKNGAGKSTLLKILSRVTTPTTGEVQLRGRVASLLEVGTGFHPELTGRENVYLNGTILGMTKADVDRQFDAIVDFAGIEQFIDTPVKRYSSGMTVRLGFAVAAHLDPEILIVDEVLAVGDAGFQMNCIGKMNEVAGNGRTVLFVSHNMSAVATLCRRGLVFADGQLIASDVIFDAVNIYLEQTVGTRRGSRYVGYEPAVASLDSPVTLHAVYVRTEQGRARSDFRNTETVEVVLRVTLLRHVRQLKFGIEVVASNGAVVFQSYSTDIRDVLPDLRVGPAEIVCRIPGGTLNAGQLSIRPLIGIHRGNWFVKDVPGPKFSVEFDVPNSEVTVSRRTGLVAPLLVWSVKPVASPSDSPEVVHSRT